MPTKYRPQLDHVGYDWTSDQFYQSLRRSRILEKLGFYNAHQTARAAVREAAVKEPLRELSGALDLAAAIRMDAGFKAPNKIIATLTAIHNNPTLILDQSIEPEALGVLALHYQRRDEAPGTFWPDIYGEVEGSPPDLQQVRASAAAAILAMKAEARPGRPADVERVMLARKGREIFLRYNPTVTRHSVVSVMKHKGGKSKFFQVEGGPFLEFLEEWLAPLNSFFATLSKDYCARVSPAGLAKMVMEFERAQLAQAPRYPVISTVTTPTQLSP